MRYIAELREGEFVQEVYLCKQTQTLKAKTGKSYMSLTLQDKSGTLDAKIWELGAGVGHFEAMDYVKVDGQVTSFQGALQLNIRRIRKADAGEYDEADYMPCTEKDVKEMYRELMGYINSLTEPHLKELANSFFANAEFSKRFVKHSAAKSVHHGFVGGLLEHTVSVTRMCDWLSKNYPFLNRNLLLTAAMFHDIGKLEEISQFPENDYTDNGNLLGHIYLGAELVGARAQTIAGFPKKLLSELQHCILAHHGELEFGSPKKPALVEALALSMADNLDAKMETMYEMFRGADGDAWLGYQRLLESNVRPTGKW